MATSSIGYDCTFELNEFNQPRIRSEIEVIKNTVLFILFTIPGQYPSLPMIGMDINSILGSYFDDIDTQELKTRIVQQCSALGICFSSGSIDIRKIIYKDNPSLLIHIEGKETFPPGYMSDGMTTVNKYLVGVSLTKTNEIIYNVNAQ